MSTNVLSTQQETLAEGVVRSDHELVATGDLGAAREFGKHRVLGTEGRRLHDPPGKARPHATLRPSYPVRADPASRVTQSEAAPGPRARRRTVHLALGELAYLSAVDTR